MIDKIVDIENIVVSLIRDNDDPMLDGEYGKTMESIKDQGVLQPLLVRQEDDGKYQLIDGFMCLHICRALKISRIPIRIMDQVDVEQGLAEMVLLAPIKAIKTKPCEYAMVLLRILTANKDLTKEELSVRLDRSVGWINKRLRLNDLIDEAKDLVDIEKISVTNGYNLARLGKKKQKVFLKAAQTLKMRAFHQKVRKELREEELWRR